MFRYKQHNDLPPISTVNFKFLSKELKNSSDKLILYRSSVYIVM